MALVSEVVLFLFLTKPNVKRREAIRSETLIEDPRISPVLLCFFGNGGEISIPLCDSTLCPSGVVVVVVVAAEGDVSLLGLGEPKK